MLDLDWVEDCIKRPSSSALDREMLLAVVAELRELRARVAALEAIPPPAPLPESGPDNPPPEWAPAHGRLPDSAPTPPARPVPPKKGKK